MKPNHTTEINKEALERASKLLNAIMDEKVSEETKSKIREWFAGDMSNEEKYTALKQLFIELEPNLTPDAYEYEQCRKISRMLGFEEEKTLKPVAPLRLNIGRYMRRVAAVLIPTVIIFGVTYLWLNRSGESIVQPPQANVWVSTPAGGQKHIILPDGSQVWVNTSSEISYNDDFSNERLVSLTGEAFFSVISNPEHPFRVKLDKLTVEVFGTEFNVRSHSNEVSTEVTLVNGSVRVVTRDNKEIELEPNERLTFDNVTSEITVERIDTDLMSKWRADNLRFKDVPLDEALQKVAAFFGYDLQMPGWVPTNDLINLDYYEELSIDQVLSILRDISGNFEYEITNQTVTITQTP